MEQLANLFQQQLHSKKKTLVWLMELREYVYIYGYKIRWRLRQDREISEIFIVSFCYSWQKVQLDLSFIEKNTSQTWKAGIRKKYFS